MNSFREILSAYKGGWGVKYLPTDVFSFSLNRMRFLPADRGSWRQYYGNGTGTITANAGDYEITPATNALNYYEDAVNNSDNEFTTPRYLFKQAIVHELNGDYDKALDIFRIIKADYKKSKEAQGIEKYISRAETR